MRQEPKYKVGDYLMRMTHDKRRIQSTYKIISIEDNDKFGWIYNTIKTCGRFKDHEVPLTAKIVNNQVATGCIRLITKEAYEIFNTIINI